jgi:serine/threonine protein kinase
MLPPHTVLQSRYRIVRQLGQGGMGTVYEAVDQRFNSTIALKETFFQEEALRKAFEREANLLHRLRHPAVPRVTDHFTEEDGQFLVMEFISGKDLWQMVQESGGPFAPDKVLDWADQILDALEYLHSQRPPVVHRDIKPQNLKLTEEGRIILLDFGLAKGTFGLNTSLVTSRSVMGFTPNFAPLEQMQGTGTGPKSDLYSLAATLYYLMTGKVPTDALSRATAIMSDQPDPLYPVNEIDSKVSSEVAEVIQQAMSTNPAKRPDTAAEMREALQKANKIQAPADNQSDLPSTITLPAPTKAAQEQSINSNLSKTQALQLEYWTAFRDHLQQRNSFLKPQKPQAQNWFPITIAPGFRLEATTNTKVRQVCAYLVLSGSNAKPHFHLLQKDEEAIKREIGEELKWSELETRKQCYVFLCRHKTDPENWQDWETQHEWLKEKLELFHKVFAPRIKHLNASEYVSGTMEEAKQEIPPTIANSQPEQKPEELVSTIAAPLPKAELPRHSPSPVTPALQPNRSPLIMVGVGALLIIGLVYFIAINRTGSTAENSNRGANSAQISNVAVIPNPTLSPTPVLNLEGTNWEFIRNGSYKESFEFKPNGKVTRRFESDVRNGKWTRQGNQVSIFIEGNGVYYGFAIEGVIQGEGMRGQYIFGKQENQNFFARRIQ